MDDIEGRIEVGQVEMSLSTRRLKLGDQEVVLEESALRLLDFLMRSPGEWKDANALMPSEREEAARDDWLTRTVGAINEAFASSTPDCYVAHHPPSEFMFVAPRESDLRPSSGQAVITPLIGRDDALAKVIDSLARHRFVTIVGTGGLGKTSLARAVARSLEDVYTDGIFFVDLSPVARAEALPAAAAATLGMLTRGVELLPSLKRWLSGRKVLVILDGCERLPEAAAHVAEAILSAGFAGVIATSREALRADGEFLYRLAPMQLPPAITKLSSIQARRFSAIDLFVRRAGIAGADLVFRDSDVDTVVSLCAGVDGIPLAIEILAVQAARIGLDGLAEQVRSKLLLFRGRQEGAPPRHETLSALLDWSYDLLSESERLVLQRISVFTATFTGDAASMVAAQGDLEAADVEVCLLDLHAKSLVAREPVGQPPRFRLLDTTRAYAIDKLGVSPDLHAVYLSLAGYLLSLLRQAEADWELLDRSSWLKRYAASIDDIRSALDWAFGPAGERSIGIQLTIASIALARQLSLDAEFDGRVELALHALAELPGVLPLPQVQLNAILGSLRIRIESHELQVVSTLERNLVATEPSVANKHRVATLVSIWASAVHRGIFQVAMGWSVRIDEVARGADDPIIDLIAGRIRAQSSHFMGCHADAFVAARKVLDNAWRKIPLAYNPSPIELRVSMRIILARVFWLQGFPDQALGMARQAMAYANSDTPLARCQVLALALIPISAWSGHLDGMAELVASLEQTSVRHAIAHWQLWGDGYRALLVDRVEPSEDFGTQREEDPSLANLRDHLATFDGRWMRVQGVQRAVTGMVGWCAPEMLRVQAERALLDDPTDLVSGAEELFRHSLELAQRQGAKAWQLRSTTSLARLLHTQGRSTKALEMLEPVVSALSEGFHSIDAVKGRSLLAEVLESLEDPIASDATVS